MSIVPLMWAMYLAPVPYEEVGRGRPRKDGTRRPQPSSSCAFVLCGLANHADERGMNAFPTIESLCVYTRLGERTIQGCVGRLNAERIITPCDPRFVEISVAASKQRTGWNLAMDRVREDLTEGQLRWVAKTVPFLAPIVERALSELEWVRLGCPQGGAVVSDGVQSFPTGCSGFTGGVQSFQSDSEMTAPEPSFEPSLGTKPPLPPQVINSPVPVDNTGRGDKPPTGTDGHPRHVTHPNAQQWAKRIAFERKLPVPPGELLAWCYRLGDGDPWVGHSLVDAETQGELGSARNPRAALRARLRRASEKTCETRAGSGSRQSPAGAA